MSLNYSHQKQNYKCTFNMFSQVLCIIKLTLQGRVLFINSIVDKNLNHFSNAKTLSIFYLFALCNTQIDIDLVTHLFKRLFKQTIFEISFYKYAKIMHH